MGGGLIGKENKQKQRLSGEWREKMSVCGQVGEEGGFGGNERERGVFERKHLRLTWPWGPIIGLLGLCVGGCAWGDC